MLLTKCAACAAPLAYNAPRCVRCRSIGSDSSDSDSEYTEALSTLALCLAATGLEAEAKEVTDALEILIEGYDREQQRQIDELKQQRQDLTNRLTKALDETKRTGSG